MTSGDWLPAQAPFDLVRRGFSPEQVTAHLERLEYDLRIATANREATVQRVTELGAQLAAAHGEADALRGQLDRSALEPISMANLSDRMQRMIRLAEEEASEIRARAEAEGERLRGLLDSALGDVAQDKLTFDAERERTRKQLADQVHDLLAEATAEAKVTGGKATDAASLAVSEANAEAARTVRDANAEAEQTVGQARADAEQTVASANAFAEQRVGQANADAEQTVGNANAFAEQTVGRARADAEQTVGDANAFAEQTMTHAHQTATDELAAARAEAESTVTNARTVAADLTAASQAERERLEAEATDHRNQVQDDFDIAIAARRAEANRVIAEREQVSVFNAEKLVGDARALAEKTVRMANDHANALVERAAAESSQRVMDADGAVRELTDLRAVLLDQLASLSGHLDHIRGLAGSSAALLVVPDTEVGRIVSADFPADPAGRPTPVAQDAAFARTPPDSADPDGRELEESIDDSATGRSAADGFDGDTPVAPTVNGESVRARTVAESGSDVTGSAAGDARSDDADSDGSRPVGSNPEGQLVSPMSASTSTRTGRIRSYGQGRPRR